MGKNNEEQVSGIGAQTNMKGLFDEYYSRLVYFSFQILHDKSQAEDVAQDAFVKYWDNLNAVSGDPIAVKNFLYATCKYAALNIIRHNKVIENHLSEQRTEAVEEAVITHIIRSEVLAEIDQAIALLPDGCQQIFKLSYLNGMKNNQIAEMLGISINTVKTQKQRALKTLRVQLSHELMIMILAAAAASHLHF